MYIGTLASEFHKYILGTTPLLSWHHAQLHNVIHRHLSLADPRGTTSTALSGTPIQVLTEYVLPINNISLLTFCSQHQLWHSRGEQGTAKERLLLKTFDKMFTNNILAKQYWHEQPELNQLLSFLGFWDLVWSVPSFFLWIQLLTQQLFIHEEIQVLFLIRAHHNKRVTASEVLPEFNQ